MAGDAILNLSAQITLDGTGYGVLRIGPTGEQWWITRTMVRCTTRVDEAVCTMYQTNIGANFQKDISYTGSTGDTSDTEFHITDGDALYVEWANGDIGAVATVTISGTRSNPFGGFRAVS